jgi:hypothetical protein
MMSRVEPEPQKRSNEPREQSQRQPVDRKPSKAEGDEQTVNEALRNDERQRR